VFFLEFLQCAKTSKVSSVAVPECPGRQAASSPGLGATAVSQLPAKVQSTGWTS